MQLRKEDVDPESRKVAVSFSSETDKVRFWGVQQVLLHEEKSADVSTLASVLFNHDPDQVVGRADDVRVDTKDRMGRADIVFDEDDESDRVFSKIKSGSIKGISVGFRVDKWQILDEGDSWTSPEGRSFEGPADIATSWRAIEFSVTPIPADPSVGIGRSEGHQPANKQEVFMNAELKAALVKRGLGEDATDEEAQAFMLRLAEEDNAPPEKTPEEVAAEKDRADREVKDRAERDRTTEIRSLCETFKLDRKFETDLLEGGASVEDARGQILARLQKERPRAGNEKIVEIGEESRDKFRDAGSDWIALRTWRGHKIDEKRAAAARDIPCLNLMDLARECLRQAGIRVSFGDREAILNRAMSHTSSDFPNILANVAHKSLLAAYQEAPSTWRPLTRKASMPDFKVQYRNRLGDAGNLMLTPDGAPMPETSFAENVESYGLATYTRRFGCTRKMIINDDLNAFDRIPRQMGQTAARVPQTLFWDLLTSASGVGPTMAEDSKALFATDHTSGANYTAGALAIAIAGLGTAKTLMRKQTGLVATGETAPTLNIVPMYIVVPAALETLAEQVVAQITPALIASTQPNWIKSLQVIVEPRLDGKTDGATAWYLAADPSYIDGAEVAFLDGREEPNMVELPGTNILGMEWGVYFDCAVKFVDHRGWYRAKGA